MYGESTVSFSQTLPPKTARPLDHGPGVMQQLEELEKHIEALGEAFASLAHRIDPILRPSPPELASGGSLPAEAAKSAVCEKLAALHRKVGLTLSMIGDVGQRVAL